MLLATKCPHCKTTFKVANDQLKLQSGLVRCGMCHQVFNGIEHLAPASPDATTVKINTPTVSAPSSISVASHSAASSVDSELAAPDAEASGVQHEIDLFDTFEMSTDRDDRIEPTLDAPETEPELEMQVDRKELDVASFPSILNDEFSNSIFRAEFEDKIQALLDADLRAEQQAAQEAQILTLPASDSIIEEIVLDAGMPDPVTEEAEPATDAAQYSEEAEEEIEEEPDAEDDVFDDTEVSGDEELAELIFIRQARNRKRLAWFLSVGTVLLLILLIGQALYQLRDIVAAAYPASKNTLVTLCKIAHCQISLPAQLDAVSTEAEELHTLARPNTFEFSLLMRNHSALTQAWPSIELTLKGDKKQVQLKKVFSPADYLSDPHDVANGFAPNSEQAVKIYFEMDKVKATDFVVSAFYP